MNLPEPHERLNRTGIERRERLLVDLRLVVQRRGRARRVQRACFAIAAMALTGIGTMFVHRASRVDVRQASAVASAATAPLRKASGEQIQAGVVRPGVELITTVPGVALRINQRAAVVSTATDEDLMLALVATGQDPGIVRVDGRVVNLAQLTEK